MYISSRTLLPSLLLNFAGHFSYKVKMPSRRQQTINETYTWSQVLRTKRTFASFKMYMLQKPVNHDINKYD